MGEASRAIFRTEAVNRYIQGREQAILPQDHIRGVTSLSQTADVLAQCAPDLLLIECSGNDLAAAFDPAFVDMRISLVDITDGERVLTRGGTGLTRSDLLLLNKSDLLIQREMLSEERLLDLRKQREGRPSLVTSLLNGAGLDAVVEHIERFLQQSPQEHTMRAENLALVEEQWFWGYKLSRGAHSHFGSDAALRRNPVCPLPMSSAPMRYEQDGSIAWDQMWTDFCDLAALGGPPHRGTLLEPVALTEIVADPAGYHAALAEIERGLRLVAGLPGVQSSLPGWTGLACENETMAIWLQKAILAENVSVRRQRQVIYLPVGPRFRLKEEVKNVITAVAKTHHYWQEHLRHLQQREVLSGQESLPEMWFAEKGS